MLAEQVDHALRRGLVEKPHEVLCGLSGNLSASGEEALFIRGERGFDVIGSGDERLGEFRAIIHGKVRAFACERRHQVRGIAK